MEELSGKIRTLCRQIDKEGREYWWLRSEVNEVFEDAGYHLIPRHFYSPVPDPALVASHDFAANHFPLDALGWDTAAGRKLLEGIQTTVRELSDKFPSDREGPADFYWRNPFFTGLDAAMLHFFVREWRPNRILEIGSGYSSLIALNALSANGSGRLTCVEPYPSQVVRALGDRIDLLNDKVQSVPLGRFDQLMPGDILFVDSSHVAALGSDVLHQMFNILPRLKKGVIIQIHDIFLPFDYPASWVKERRWYWNEQYVLYALMRLSDAFRILSPNHYLAATETKLVNKLLHFVPEENRTGASFWIEKVQ